MKYEFTNDWFNISFKNNFKDLLDNNEINKILEIGSFEGAVACYLADNYKNKTIYCIDHWKGNPEHQSYMEGVYKRYLSNTYEAFSKSSCNLITIKENSHIALANMYFDLYESFDLIYVDANHNPKDVLQDAVLAFNLLKPGGFMVFDDYLWHDWKFPKSIGTSTKLGIDSFINCYFDEMQVLPKYNISQIIIYKYLKEKREEA